MFCYGAKFQYGTIETHYIGTNLKQGPWSTSNSKGFVFGIYIAIIIKRITAIFK